MHLPAGGNCGKSRQGRSLLSRRAWLRCSPALLCLVSPIFLWTISASAATSGFSSLPAGAIVALARSAMTQAGSVSASGGGQVTASGAGVVTFNETNYSGKTSGSQMVTVSSVQSGSTANFPAGSVLVVHGALYVNANAALWSSSAGYSNTKSILLEQKWVQVPPSSSFYDKAAADLTMSSLTKDLFHAKSYHKGSIRTVDGVRVIEITYANTGADAGRVSAYIALGGKHLPVSVTIGGVALQLGSWGVAKTVTTPQGSVPLASVLTSSST